MSSFRVNPNSFCFCAAVSPLPQGHFYIRFTVKASKVQVTVEKGRRPKNSALSVKVCLILAVFFSKGWCDQRGFRGSALLTLNKPEAGLICILHDLIGKSRK